MTIAGASKPIHLRGEIHAQANGRATFLFDVRSQDGSYRPALDADVALTEDAATIFGGLITATEERGVGDLGLAPIITRVTANDYNILAARRYVTASLVSGTLKTALQTVVTFLPGCTLDAGQVNGPTLAAIEWADVKAEDALNQLSTMAGAWPWRISATKVLKMYEPSTLPAPFSIVVPSSKAIGDVVVEPSRDGYANRVIVRNTTVREVAEDATDIGIRGPYELLVGCPDTTTAATAQALAQAILAQSLVVLKQVRYTTKETGLQPGQTQTITLPTRNVNNTFLITELRTVLDAHFPNVVMRFVTAIEGLMFKNGWRETYRQWGGGAQVIAGAGVGSPSFLKLAYFLGGSSAEGVRSATPTWVPVSGGSTPSTGANQVQIDTVPRGTLLATVKVRLKALDTGVTVKARLWDATANAACPGESALVTNTQWEFQAFTATLTAGNHLYELQVLPGTADALVFGVGTLE